MFDVDKAIGWALGAIAWPAIMSIKGIGVPVRYADLVEGAWLDILFSAELGVLLTPTSYFVSELLDITLSRHV